MTYPVFLYNVFLIAAYVLLAAIFFYLYKSRSSKLAFWCAIFFGLAFIDNSIFFMKEVFLQIGHTDTILTRTHWLSEMGFQALFAFMLRMVIGYYLDDKPGWVEIIALIGACLIIACITLAGGPENIPLSALPVFLYAWVFLRGVFKAKSPWIRVCLLVLLALYVAESLFRLFDAVELLSFWEHRNMLIESYWTVYLILGIYIAATLLRTAEETYTPDETVVFQQFLNQYGLSQREGDIALLLMEGATNQAISNQLFLALGTVKAHNYHIYKKLGIEHRTQVLLKYTEYLEDRAKRK